MKHRLTWVEVRWQHAAWSKVEHCHGKTIADDCRESCRIGIHDRPWRECVDVLRSEVEEPIGVVRKEGQTIELRSCSFELGDELWVLSGSQLEGKV